MRDALWNRKRGNVVPVPPILKDEYGRPCLPDGVWGSISHKKTTGVALVARSPTEQAPESSFHRGIGVDIEEAHSGRRSVGRRVLTENERDRLGGVRGISADEEVLLRFSLKESLYKAIHPLICQYVGFQEIEVQPWPDGRASVVWRIDSGAHRRFGEVTAHWRKVDADRFFLTSASVALRECEDEPLAN